jgi:aminoglycoside phosphotransferase (APT) family kinase protein
LPDEKANWERATPATPLSVAEIEALLTPWLKDRVVLDAELLDGGLMNRNYCLHLIGSPEVCVLRLYDRDPAACGREVAILRRLRGRVPVPEVFYARVTPAPNSPARAVISFVNGISLYDLRERGDLDALAEASYDVGRVLASLSQYPYDEVGPLTPNLEVNTSLRPGSSTEVRPTNAAVIDQLMQVPVFQTRVNGDLRERIQWFAYSNDAHASEGAGRPQLVHGDFNSRNVFVHRTIQGWRVSAILDWEFALAASPFVDIGNFLRYERPTRRMYEPSFSRGLRDGGMALPDDWMLLARLMDLPACVEMIGRPHTPTAVVDELRKLIAETVTM